jgi:CBS domain-containing protein
MRVKDIMTSNASCVQASESLSAAAKLMWDCDCGAVPVIDESSKVIGMITDRDICMSCWTQDRSPSALQVSQSMSRELYSCSPEDTLASAESTMRSKQVRRLPVTDGQGRLAGIISLADLVKHTSGARRDVVPEELAKTLAGICQTRGHAAPPIINA